MSARTHRLEVEESDDCIVVRFSETLSLIEENIPPFAAELCRMAARLGRRPLCLDFGRVDFLTSSALGQLISLNKKVRAEGGRLVLCNVSPLVYEVFETTRLHTLMDIHPAAQPPPGSPSANHRDNQWETAG